MKGYLAMGLVMSVLAASALVTYFWFFNPKRLMESNTWVLGGFSPVHFMEGNMVVGNVVKGKYDFVGRRNIVYEHLGDTRGEFVKGLFSRTTEIRLEGKRRILLTVEFEGRNRQMTWFLSMGSSKTPYLRFARYAGGDRTTPESRATVQTTPRSPGSVVEMLASPTSTPTITPTAVIEWEWSNRPRPDVDDVRPAGTPVPTPLPEFQQLSVGG